MDRNTFLHNLEKASIQVVELTKTYCYNDFVSEHRYIIRPSSPSTAEFLTPVERETIEFCERFHNSHLLASQVVSMLWKDGEVPQYIDICVAQANKEYTLLELFCSGRLCEDEKLYNQSPWLPFHLQVIMPPEWLKIERNGKFDVNW